MTIYTKEKKPIRFEAIKSAIIMHVDLVNNYN